MSRENRKENRMKAKDAANANANANADGAKNELEKEGAFDQEDIEDFLKGDNEDAIDGDGDGDGDGGDSTADTENVDETDIDSLGNLEKKDAPVDDKSTGVDKKKSEEEVKEEEVVSEDDKAKPGEEKKAGEEAKKPEEKTEPTKAAPTDEKTKVEEGKEEEGKTEEPKILSPEDARKLYGEWRGKTESLLAEHHYKLSEDDVAELNENPAAYIPKIAAKVYLDTISASFQQFVTYLPRMVDQVLVRRNEREQREERFFSRWSDLREHKDVVFRLGKTYRQENPTATEEDFINEVGAQAMVALRKTPKVEEKKASDEKEKKSFKPAGTSPSASAPPSKKSDNPFEIMAEEFMSEFTGDEGS